MACIEPSTVARQSQAVDPKTSPITQWECMRTSTGSLPLSFSRPTSPRRSPLTPSPLTRATRDSSPAPSAPFNGAPFAQGRMRSAAAHFALISNQAELAVARPNQRFADPMHVTLMLHAIANEFGHGQHLHVVRFAELDEVGDARHGAVVAHDFADHACGNHSR